jgi:hypothetical protein
MNNHILQQALCVHCNIQRLSQLTQGMDIEFTDGRTVSALVAHTYSRQAKRVAENSQLIIVLNNGAEVILTHVIGKPPRITVEYRDEVGKREISTMTYGSVERKICDEEEPGIITLDHNPDYVPNQKWKLDNGNKPELNVGKRPHHKA